MPETIGPIDIVKAGTNSLIRHEGEAPVEINLPTFRSVGEQANSQEGPKVIIVSSAAIAMGMLIKGMKHRPDQKTEMRTLQRLSGEGLAPLMNQYDRHIDSSGIMLLT